MTDPSQHTSGNDPTGNAGLAGIVATVTFAVLMGVARFIAWWFGGHDRKARQTCDDQEARLVRLEKDLADTRKRNHDLTDQVNAAHLTVIDAQHQRMKAEQMQVTYRVERDMAWGERDAVNAELKRVRLLGFRCDDCKMPVPGADVPKGA